MRNKSFEKYIEEGKNLAVELKAATHDWYKVEGEMEEAFYFAAYIGTTFELAPSGKYYTFFASSNVTKDEAKKDASFWEGFEDEMGNDYWIECSEGCFTDILLCTTEGKINGNNNSDKG